MNRALVLVALLGCSSKSTRDAGDCVKLRAAVAEATADTPRRYRDDAIRSSAALKQLDLHDETLRSAVRSADVTYERLERLCSRGAADRDRDCAEVRAILTRPFALPRRGESVGIFDPGLIDGLKHVPYHDPSVRDAALAYVRDAPPLFFAEAGADWSSIDRLTKLCNLPSTQ